MYFLAIDIGASSGRHIVGWREDGTVKTEEVYRFPNGVIRREGHLIWDIPVLLREVRKGIDLALERYGTLSSLAIDTWAVDYVLMEGDKELYPVYAYRDGRTQEVIDRVHEILPFHELYQKTGIQFQPFNSIYQLYWDKLAGRLDRATDWLMLPEYLSYKLCEVKAREYTNATSTGLVNAKTKEFDFEICEALGFPKRLMPKLARPGTVLGSYKGIPVVLCASHDTASAVEGTPMGENDLYLSTGTWSLLGVRLRSAETGAQSEQTNYTNEGGPGYIRYLKNIMGMWVPNELRRELCPEAPFPELVREAEESSFSQTVDVNHRDFLAPESMKRLFDDRLSPKPETRGDYFRCAYLSLAEAYKTAVEELERNLGRTFDTLYIVGGGAKNRLLNELVRQRVGKPVVALPIEATTLGNLKIQMERIYGTV